MQQKDSIKIFVVDDDPFCLGLYKQHLSNLNCSNVTTFSSGTDCLNGLVQQPDVIFMDYDMDISNGVRLLKKIKQCNPDIYVVFISGREDAQTAANAIQHGAFDYIVKGIDEEKRIEQVLGKIDAINCLIEKRNSN